MAVLDKQTVEVAPASRGTRASDAAILKALGRFTGRRAGIILTFGQTPLYSGYLHPHDELGALALIRVRWGLDALTDQQLGGAFMWVLGSAVYLWGILVLVADYVLTTFML